MRIRPASLVREVVRHAFVVLAVLYFLVPPGYCLCDGWNDLLPANPVTAEEDHAPGCPARRTPYLPQAPDSGPGPDLTPGPMVLADVACPVASNQEGTATPLHATSPPALPVYLDLLVLLI